MNINNFEQEKKWLLKEKYGVKNESDLKGGKSEAFSTDLKKLKNDEPLAFLIGFVDFLNCKIDLKFKPLIPRPETEFWVNNFIQNELKEKKIKKNKIEILDIFSGSGCIGISLLKNSKNVFVNFAEINPDFIKQIKKNISLNFPTSLACKFLSKKLTSKACWKIYQSDVFKNLPEKKWDYILANPPYIPKNKVLNKSVKNFEDYNSLFAEDNGLYFIKKIISEGLFRLKPQGKIFIEFDENSKNKIKKFLKEKNIKNFEFKKDQFDNARLLMIWN